MLCYRCKKPGHDVWDCTSTVKVCDGSGGIGHGRDVCPSVQQEAGLVVEMPLSEEKPAVEVHAFMANAVSGECESFMPVEMGEQARQC